MKANRNYIYCLLSFFILSFILLTDINGDIGSSSTWRNFSSAGNFITAITWDKDNHLWVAGEEFGVSLIDGTSIKTFDIPYCYTIVCDDLGRVWVGSLRQGLFCYENGQWKNFNTSNGLPGNSVHAIALDKHNTLYCATGLNLAKLSEGKWEILPLPEKLPKSEISCMDFDGDGNLWVGFFLGGVAKFNGMDWQLYPIIKKSSVELSNEISTQEDSPEEGVFLNLNNLICKGVSTQKDGLMNERVNDILVAKDGTVWVTTCKGISSFQPKTGSSTSVGHWRSFAYMCDTLLAESPTNYFLKIAQDNSNNIFFTNPLETIKRWDNEDSCLIEFAPKEQLPPTSVYCITTDDDGYVWAGTYGGGIITNNPSFSFPEPIGNKLPSPPKKEAGGFLNGAEEINQVPIITLEEVPAVDFSKDTYQKQLISKAYDLLKNTPEEKQACYLGEDWLTRGDWMGKYGKYAWILCAYYHTSSLMGGCDRLGLETFKHIMWNAYIGENADPDDIIRGWLHWASTDSPKVLQDPLGGGRRQTEWDDHAEFYSRTLIREGPHMYLDLNIPEGVFLISFYFMNKDGHEGMNRFRDYTVSIKNRTSSEKEFEDSPVLASCRVHDFIAGVYKRFMLKGPGKYTIKFDKKESYNTILSAVFIDKIEKP